MGLPPPPPSLTAAMALLLLAAAAARSVDAKLSPDYYAGSCPQLPEIISRTVTDKQIASSTTAAGTLRLFFHDCFLDGCDASVLITSNAFNTAERDADINLSLPGDAFDAVVRAKTALELECPGVVSCSDVLALATRDLVAMLGGPVYPVLLGRKDSLVSRAAGVEGHHPRPNASVSALLDLFARRGLSARDLVALSGAHTVGFSHCKEFAERLRLGGAGGGKVVDAATNPHFADGLRRICAGYEERATIAVFNDVIQYDIDKLNISEEKLKTDERKKIHIINLN